MSDRKPLASLSLDADDLWSYLKTHGDPAWERRPSYLARFFPRALDVFDELELKITFFIIGFDAARAENHPALSAVTARGHEVANHSFAHETWLHLYSREQLEDDIARAEEAIVAATGQRPLGFRGPGFSWCPTLFEVLERRGYRYDASTLPTYLGPLARLYFLWTAKLTPEERKRRSALFGSFRDGLRPVHPYHWQLGERRSLLEIPVTTIPVVKVPFHMSYLLYLSRFSTALMSAYLRAAILACRAMRVEPSFLLHPLDIMGGDEVPELAFFPGMDLPSRRKVELFKQVLRTLGEHFELVPMGAHASSLLAKSELRRQQLALAS
jgi:peptidoglycan/xylan/chitin deacetylase (PgdA/CDA1 family)